MNIYLTGAHGTGKTTVAKIISEQSAFSTLPSVARHSPYKSGTIDNQRYVMDKVFCRSTKYDSVILERTPLDVFAYTHLMGLRQEYGRQKMKVDAFFRGVEYRNESVFYFPICFELENDGVRPSAKDQQQIDKFIKEYLDSEGVSYHTIPNDLPELRSEFILERSTQGACI